MQLAEARVSAREGATFAISPLSDAARASRVVYLEASSGAERSEWLQALQDASASCTRGAAEVSSERSFSSEPASVEISPRSSASGRARSSLLSRASPPSRSAPPSRVSPLSRSAPLSREAATTPGYPSHTSSLTFRLMEVERERDLLREQLRAEQDSHETSRANAERICEELRDELLSSHALQRQARKVTISLREQLAQAEAEREAKAEAEREAEVELVQATGEPFNGRDQIEDTNGLDGEKRANAGGVEEASVENAIEKAPMHFIPPPTPVRPSSPLNSLSRCMRCMPSSRALATTTNLA